MDVTILEFISDCRAFSIIKDSVKISKGNSLNRDNFDTAKLTWDYSPKSFEEIAIWNFGKLKCLMIHVVDLDVNDKLKKQF